MAPKTDTTTFGIVHCPGTCGACLFVTEEQKLKCLVPRCTHYDQEWEMPTIELTRVPAWDEEEDGADWPPPEPPEPPEPPSPSVVRLRKCHQAAGAGVTPYREKGQ